MTSLSSRQISISSHNRRRKSSGAFVRYGSGGGSGSLSSGGGSGSGSGGGGGSSDGGRRWSSRGQFSHGQHLADSQIVPPRRPPSHQPQHPPPKRQAAPGSGSYHPEGGYDSHAASYGNYDAPSPHCRRGYGASDHGCYAVESYIGEYDPKAKRADLSPTRRFADPSLDLEASYSYDSDGRSSRRRKSPRKDSGPIDQDRRFGKAATAPTGPRRSTSYQDLPARADAWEEESAYSCGPYFNDPQDSSYCHSAATATTASASTSASSLSDRDERIRQGIHDAASVVATHVAGFLSFVVGIFLTLISPLVKVIKLIVGDVRGLLGDAAFLHELGSLWRMYRELRRRGGRSDDRRHGSRSGSSGYYDEESTAEGDGTLYSENSSQYVGGWQPTVRSAETLGGGKAGRGRSGSRDGSWASASGSRRSEPSPRGKGASTSDATSRSYSSLPMVREGRYSTEQVDAQASGKSSLPRSNGGHHQKREYDSRRGYYDNRSYPLQQPQQQHSRHHSSPTPPYEQLYSSGTTPYSPKKRHPQHGRVSTPQSRARNCLI